MNVSHRASDLITSRVFFIDDLPYDDADGYDYSIVIQERLKRANEEFEHDRTSSELKQRQRVSFDAVVKAVDIVQDPDEHEGTNSLIRPSVSPVAEESSTTITSPRSETSAHEYTVPLNDTQPKEGPSLLEQIKALQFHGTLPTSQRWATTANSSSNQEGFIFYFFGEKISKNILDDFVLKSNENNMDNQDKKSMIVSINGQFDLRDEDDYTAKHNPKSTNDDNNKLAFLPAPPTEPKQKQDLPPRPFLIRPKSSDSGRRNDTKSSSDKKNKTETTNRQRPKR
jgi:hypothetical protein